MQHIYRIRNSASSDHCAECGGEEHESCGPLHDCLITVPVTSPDDLCFYKEESVCEGCESAIRARSAVWGSWA